MYILLQITIPKNDTTYWCSVSKIPQKLHMQTGYVTKVNVSPTITNSYISSKITTVTVLFPPLM